MELLLEVGGELLRKRALLVDGLLARGWEVLHAHAGDDSASGIVSFRGEARDMSQLHGCLLEAGVVTTLRTDRAGCRYVRVSPHFYNSDEELNRLLAVV